MVTGSLGPVKRVRSLLEFFPRILRKKSPNSPIFFSGCNPLPGRFTQLPALLLFVKSVLGRPVLNTCTVQSVISPSVMDFCFGRPEFPLMGGPLTTAEQFSLGVNSFQT